MAALIQSIKAALPWWAKIAAKLVLARLPVGGRAWQSLGLFSPGEMTDPDYALGIFERFYGAAEKPGAPFSFLELGPGDSLSSAIIGFAFGAERCWLVDAGSYASRDMAVYHGLIDRLSQRYPDKDLGPLRGASDIASMLRTVNAEYREGGLASLGGIPDGSCDFIFSNAVLEHVPRDEFCATLGELFRVLKPGAISPHQIDFRDHLDGGLNNLRFSEKLWEAPWFAKRSGFYTNRLQLPEMEAAFIDAGFAVSRVEPTLREGKIPDRTRFDVMFSALDDDALAVRDALVILKKPQKSAN